MASEQVEQTVSPNSLTDRITATLRDDIVNGKYAPEASFRQARNWASILV